MIYKTKEIYKIVSNDLELQDCLNSGWMLHWDDIDAKIKELKVKEVKLKK